MSYRIMRSRGFITTVLDLAAHLILCFIILPMSNTNWQLREPTLPYTPLCHNFILLYSTFLTHLLKNIFLFPYISLSLSSSFFYSLFCIPQSTLRLLFFRLPFLCIEYPNVTALLVARLNRWYYSEDRWGSLVEPWPMDPQKNLGKSKSDYGSE